MSNNPSTGTGNWKEVRFLIIRFKSTIPKGEKCNLSEAVPCRKVCLSDIREEEDYASPRRVKISATYKKPIEESLPSVKRKQNEEEKVLRCQSAL